MKGESGKRLLNGRQTSRSQKLTDHWHPLDAVMASYRLTCPSSFQPTLDSFMPVWHSPHLSLPGGPFPRCICRVFRVDSYGREDLFPF